LTTKNQVIKQIRGFCLSCMGDSFSKVMNCTAPECQLYEFRLGKDPHPSRKGANLRKKPTTEIKQIGNLTIPAKLEG